MLKNTLVKTSVALTLTLALVASLGFGFYHHPALADTKSTIQGGVCEAAGGTCPSNSGGTLSDTVASVINVLSIAAGVAAVIMIIVGGFRYVTSAGNPEGSKSAKNTLLYALGGLVIVVLAQIIVHFVLYRISNPPSNSKTSQSNSGGLSGSSSSNGGSGKVNNLR